MHEEQQYKNVIDQELISLIFVNRDAVAANRGFYFQYLSVVQSWIDNFLNGQATDIFTEVDDDIKEVGDQLIFTQLKCYSSSMSLGSPEINKSLLNFFVHYLRYSSASAELKFRFVTNTTVASKEKLLTKWIKEQPLSSGELLDACTTEISKLLDKSINQIKSKQLSKGHLSEEFYSRVEQKFSVLLALVGNQEFVSDFTSRIGWEFQKLSTEDSIDELVNRVLEKLGDPKFGARSPKLLFEAMLSEIFRRSQLTDSNDRKVNISDLSNLIKRKDDELAMSVDNRLIHLLDLRLHLLEVAVDELRNVMTETNRTQQQQGEILTRLSEQNDGATKVLSKNITSIPFINSSTILGRKTVASNIHQLFSQVRHVSVDGYGGMGKSTVLKVYVDKYRGEYDHLIWLNVEQGLVNSLALNADIARVLKLPVIMEQYTERFSQITSLLLEIPGRNLMVIDGYSSFSRELDQLRSLSNWYILVGTRLRLNGWQNFTINALDFQDAKSLYTSIDRHNAVTDSELKAFFNVVDYNTLTIKLIAKTVYNSLDLTLAKVMSHFESQELDNDELQIEILEENMPSSRLINILKATFDFDSLDSGELSFLLFFAHLPSQNTEIKDLIDWFGSENEVKNKPIFVNAINKLHDRGLIERTGPQISIHKMVQQVVFYYEIQQVIPFFSQYKHIVELKNRLQQGADRDIIQALRFLKYGEAYLSNIKERHRKVIYQPLLQLENEVLNIYNWLYKKGNVEARWVSLHKRAQVFLLENDSLLGVISNNLGLALVSNGKRREAIPYFEQAANILEVQGDKAGSQLLISLCNLCLLSVELGDSEGIKECFGRIREIRKKYKLWSDVSMPVQANVLGKASENIGDYQAAIKMFNMACELHLELAPEKRNDLQYVSYVISLGSCYVMAEQIEEAEQSAVVAVNILSRLQARDTVNLFEVTKLLLVICQIKGESQSVEQLKEVIKKMGR